MRTLLLTAALITLSAQASAQAVVTISAFHPLTCKGKPLPWRHVYHPQRLAVITPCTSVTGTIVDASKGRTKDGSRHEGDGDGHFFLKLDAGQEQFLNAKNLSNEDGNLVFEPVCLFRVKQQDAITVCAHYSQAPALVIPSIGSHVRISGAHVLDTQHGHNEIHPVSSIEVIP